MKTMVIIISVIGLMTLNSCMQEEDVQALLENTETRKEIIKTIASNHTFMTEFMEGLHNNDHAMNMLKGNKKMMDMMMDGAGMQMVVKDGNMRSNMMKTMHKKGMMSKDCMVSCMKMSQTDSDKIENHDSHNN